MKKTLALFCAALFAGGCSTMSHLSDDGRGDNVVFADPGTAWLTEGTFPSVDSLRGVDRGTNKDQLYEMFGRPHFQEGFVNVREWDYLFHFKREDGSVADCQYKVLFEPNYTVRSTHWKDPACADFLKFPEPRVIEKIVEKIVERPAEPRRVRISTDALFPFDKSALSDMLPGGAAKLDQLVADLRGAGDYDRLTVVGHTDNIGTPAYNLRLSKARAATVRQYLVAKGIAADSIQSTGLGEAVPLVQCAPEGSRSKKRIACLEPNRRVEIETYAKSGM